jgi:hypothetical protein
MILQSLKKPNEIKLWHEFNDIEDTIINAITNLQGLKFEVLMHYSNLRGYIILWNSIENAELMVNSVLHQIKDPKERKRIAKDGAIGTNILLSETDVDKEGYIEIKIDFEEDSYFDDDGKKINEITGKRKKNNKHSLWYAMNNVKKQVENSLAKYKSWESAILDFMEERGFNVKTYKDEINVMSGDVYRDIIGWDKYSGKLDTSVFHPRLLKVMKKYAVCPDPKEIKVDEEQYNWYRKFFLDGEDYPEELRGKVNKKTPNE